MTNPEQVLSPTIRGRMLSLLLLPALVVLAAGTFSDYLSSVGPIEDAFDQSLIDGALAVAAHLRTDANGEPTLVLPADSEAILRADSFDAIYFQVSADGRYIAGDVDLPHAAPGSANPARANGQYRGARIRMVTYRLAGARAPVYITVAETLHKRQRMQTRTLSRALAVDVAELAVVLAILFLGVRLVLKPLQLVREQISRRSARALEPIPLADVPMEIRTIVAELNRLFATVKESGVAQQRFLDSAAHQLRTPLAGIQAQLELLVADETDAMRQGRLALVLAAAQRLTHTTQQLLSLARSEEAAHLHWDFAEVDLGELVAAVVADCLPAADDAGIDLGAQIQAVKIEGVAWLLGEALRNLTHNAIEHTPRGGAVTITCGVRDGASFLEVTDTGVGIPVEERARVLERFYRASNARGDGSGLGLAVVLEVAHLHGANLAVGTGADEFGTTMRLTFAGAVSGALAMRPR